MATESILNTDILIRDRGKSLCSIFDQYRIEQPKLDEANSVL
jgi:hypothetical protein